jgi:hypothetical protein
LSQASAASNGNSLSAISTIRDKHGALTYLFLLMGQDGAVSSSPLVSTSVAFLNIIDRQTGLICLGVHTDSDCNLFPRLKAHANHSRSSCRKKITGSLVELPVMKAPIAKNVRKIIFCLPATSGPTWIRTRDQPVMSRGLYR